MKHETETAAFAILFFGFFAFMGWLLFVEIPRSDAKREKEYSEYYDKFERSCLAKRCPGELAPYVKSVGWYGGVECACGMVPR